MRRGCYWRPSCWCALRVYYSFRSLLSERGRELELCLRLLKNHYNQRIRNIKKILSQVGLYISLSEDLYRQFFIGFRAANESTSLSRAAIASYIRSLMARLIIS